MKNRAAHPQQEFIGVHPPSPGGQCRGILFWKFLYAQYSAIPEWANTVLSIPKTLSETKICSLNPKGRRRASPSLLCESPRFFSGLLTGKNITSCCSLFQLGIQKLASKNFPPGPYIQIGQHIKLYTTSTLNSITEFNIQSVLRSRIAHAFPVKTCI